MKKIILSVSALFVLAIFTGSVRNTEADPKKCPVCSEEVKSAKNIKYLGQDYEVCSSECAAEFKGNPASYNGGVMICSICNEDDGKASITTNYEDMKYYFCNDKCKAKFEKNPEKILENYNK